MTSSWALLRFVPATLFATVVWGLAACGGSADSGDVAEPESAALDEPVVIEHQFGTIEIDEVPERIVTIDLQWTDVMLALDVQPVGYSVDSYMPASGVPWQELPDDAEPLDFTDGPPIEQIAALDPDLIVGTYSIPDQATYDLLSGVAPTIAGLDSQQVTPWQDLVRTAGELLGESGQADDVVAAIDQEVAAAAEELPGLAGKTFALAQYVVGDSMYVVADEEDGSSVFFQQLGMTMYPQVLAEGERTGQTRINISTERADLLGSDLLAFLINGGDESDLADIPGFDQLPGTVAVLDYPTIVGLNTPSPLSIPYSLEQLRPYLEDAAAS